MASHQAGKFAKGEKVSNASKPTKVDTKKPDSEKDSEKVTRGRGKDGTPYVQKDITKDMEKLNKMKPKAVVRLPQNKGFIFRFIESINAFNVSVLVSIC